MNKPIFIERKARKSVFIIPSKKRITLFNKLFHKEKAEEDSDLKTRRMWYRNLTLNINIHKFWQNLRFQTRKFSFDGLGDYHHCVINDSTNYSKGSMSIQEHQ
jgi:hypothetical protein